MKTILNITNDHLSNIAKYCERSLVEEIFEDFSKIGQIVVSEQLELTKRIWDISCYVTPNTLCDRRKLAVILSYATLGVIKFENWESLGTTNVLIELHNLGCMSEDDFDYFCSKFANFITHYGDSSKFK